MKNKLDFFSLHRWVKNPLTLFIRESDLTINKIAKIIDENPVNVNYMCHIEELDNRLNFIFGFLLWYMFYRDKKILDDLESFMLYRDSLENPPF